MVHLVETILGNVKCRIAPVWVPSFTFDSEQAVHAASSDHIHLRIPAARIQVENHQCRRNHGRCARKEKLLSAHHLLKVIVFNIRLCNARLSCGPLAKFESLRVGRRFTEGCGGR